MDVEALLIAELAQLDTVAAAATQVPGNLEQLVPFVQITLFPSDEWVKPWNARGWDKYAIDVDVYTAADPATAGTEAVAVAAAVREHLRGLEPAGLVTLKSPVLVPRPEKNPRLRHRGATFEFLAR